MPGTVEQKRGVSAGQWAGMVLLPMASFFCGYSLRGDPAAEEVSPDESQTRSSIPAKALGARFSRPEERGELFTDRDVDELLQRLDSPDHIERRKAAIELGNRGLAGSLQLSSSQSLLLRTLIKKELEGAKSSDPNRRSEARLQMERLWTVAVPVLVEILSDEEVAVREAAAGALLKIRSPEVIDEMALVASDVSNEALQSWLCTSLWHIRDCEDAIVSGRISPGPEETDKVFKDVVRPALEKMRWTPD